MREMPIWFTIKLNHLTAKLFQKRRKRHSTSGIYGIQHYFEFFSLHCLCIYHRQGKNFSDMNREAIFSGFVFTKVIHLRIAEILTLSKRQNLSAVFSIDKFSFFIKKFQSVPLFRVMRSRKDNSAICPKFWHHHLHRRRSRKPKVYHMDTQPLQSSRNQRRNHLPRNSGISTDNERQVLFTFVILKPRPKCRGKFNHIQRREIISHFSSDSPSNS